MEVFFQGPLPLVRIIMAIGISYPALILFLRVSGKRTLAKLNAFDLVITVAIGSCLANLVLNERTPILNGVFALLLLIFSQFAVAWLSLRSSWFRNLVKSQPTPLFEEGEFKEDALRNERLSKSDVFQKVRSAGHSSMDSVDKVMLESDGDLSVIRKS